MPLGMEEGLSPGDFVLDGDPAPYPKRGGAPPNFRSAYIVAKRLHGSRCHIVFDVDPATPRKKGTPTPTKF